MSARDIREVISLNRARAAGLTRLTLAPRVLIESDNGFWRADYAGYTFKDQAAIYTGLDAYEATRHCGPEKRVRYHVLREPRRQPALALSADGALGRHEQPSTGSYFHIKSSFRPADEKGKS